MRLECKFTRYGLVEIRQEGCSYGLYVADVLKYSSSDKNYIMSKYNEYN